MAAEIITNCKLYFDKYDLSGQMNALAVDYGAEMQDTTAFGDGTRVRQGGLKTVSISHEGYWEGGTDNIDDALFASVSQADVPMTICPRTGAEGEIAFALKSILGQYSPGAEVGSVFAFSVSGECSGDGLINGWVLLNATKIISGNGSAFNLGAVSSTKKLYAALHVLAVSGSSPTLAVKVQSDDASGMATPLDKITFITATGKGSQWATPITGPIPDSWWRINYTIGGTSPSFTFVVFVGIQ